MRKTILIAALMVGSMSLSANHVEIDSLFSKQTKKGELIDPEMIESSGLTISRTNPGLLWTHNDSGDKPRLFLIDTDGSRKLTVNLEGASNIDWEDIASFEEDGKNFICVGDIGDNRAVRENIQLYIFEEPKWDGESKEITIDDFKKMSFTYEEGARDAETLMIDPITKNIIILSKRDPKALVYEFEFLEGENHIVKNSGIMNITGFTAGDINQKGEIVIKNYNKIYLFRSNGKGLVETLLGDQFIEIPYKPEPQGESIAWSSDYAGFYTVSEKRYPKSRQHIYYFSH